MNDSSLSGYDSDIESFFSAQSGTSSVEASTQETASEKKSCTGTEKQTTNSHENSVIRNKHLISKGSKRAKNMPLPYKTWLKLERVPEECGEIPLKFSKSPVLVNAFLYCRYQARHLIEKDQGDEKHRTSRIRGIVRGIVGVKGVLHYHFQEKKVRSKSLSSRAQYFRAVTNFIVDTFPLDDKEHDLQTLFIDSWENRIRTIMIFLSLNQAEKLSKEERVELNIFKVDKFFQSIWKLALYLDTPVARVLKIRDVFMDTMHYALSQAESDDLKQYLKKVIERVQSP